MTVTANEREEEAANGHELEGNVNNNKPRAFNRR
jgi:hypothetical protein